MTFPRLHLFELEDQTWLPTIVRDQATNYLRFIQAAFRLHRPIVPVLAEALRATGSQQIVDLCSGGGGPILEIHRALSAAGLETRIILTDRFPNLRAFQQIEGVSSGQISFVRESVDARSVPATLIGLRTIFNSFHHFDETDAKNILGDAVKAKQPVAIFEYPERTVLIVLLTAILTPLMIIIATPFIRPFRWSRLFLTYVLPFVPLTCWWDGIISQIRAYTVAELQSLAVDAGCSSYDWRAGRIPLANSLGHLTYLLGYPRPQ